MERDWIVLQLSEEQRAVCIDLSRTGTGPFSHLRPYKSCSVDPFRQFQHLTGKSLM